MPKIKKIALENFRNIDSAVIEPDRASTLICGRNGAGKTSLLESISVVAHGKSFRTHKYRRLIKEGMDDFTVHAEVSDGTNTEKVGISKNKQGETKIRVNGENAKTAAELAKRLPLLVLTTSSFSLLEGSPKVRRQFFDWLVFHVEHEFVGCWKNYAKSLKQRNSLLRHDKIDYSQLEPWNQEIAKSAIRLDDFRKSVFSEFVVNANGLLAKFDIGYKIKIDYKNGWLNTADSIEDQLKATFAKDVKLGYTSVGAHKSDLKIKADNVAALEVLSRGQQKILVSVLFVASAMSLKKLTARAPVFMVDDIASELDEMNIDLLTNSIRKLDLQTIITCIDPTTVSRFWSDLDSNAKMFHVEHGRFSEQAI